MSEETQVAQTSETATETQETVESQVTETQTADTVVTDNGVDTGTEVTYANGKYKSVSDLEKGYTEAQKFISTKLGGFTGAPEAYELAEGIESNSRIEALQAWGKENQLSNEALNDIIRMDAETTQAANEAYVAEQKEMLGKDAEARLNNLSDWAKAQVGEENIDVFNAMITSAKGVELMEGLMKKMQGVAPAQAPAQQTLSKEALNEMRFRIDKNSGERLMSIDPSYRAKVEKLEAEYYQSQRGA